MNYQNSLRHDDGAVNIDIVIYIADLCGGGAQRVAVQLANTWCKASKSVVVITQSRTDSDIFTLDQRVKRISTDSLSSSISVLSGLYANFLRIRTLRTEIKRLRPACLLSFGMQSNVLSVIATWDLPIRIVISERNDPALQKFSWYWETLRKLVYRHADCITANSQGALDTMASYVPFRKLALVPNPVASINIDTINLRAESEKAPFILAVGCLHEQKAYDVLLKAFARFNHSQVGDGWRLIILGDGHLKGDLLKLTHELGLDSVVEWRGFINDPTPFYREAKIFTIPSRYEGMPNALLEAMAQGCAVIISDASPGPLEMVTDGETGRVVLAEDPISLADAMGSLAEDDRLREKFGKAARKRVEMLAPDQAILIWNNLVTTSQSC